MSDERSNSLRRLAEAVPIIAPSMLKVDYGSLLDDSRAVSQIHLEQQTPPVLHWDVMDGNFVPNISYGAMVMRPVIERLDGVWHEAHLMLGDPGRYLQSFVDIGCDLVTFHIEAEGDAAELCSRLHDADTLAGIALNPETPVSAIESLVGHVDNVLVMSVNPGFGGQSFMPKVLPKFGQIRELFGPDVLLSVDGGIGPDTIGAAATAGAQLFVAGSAIFDRVDRHEATRELRKLAVDAGFE